MDRPSLHNWSPIPRLTRGLAAGGVVDVAQPVWVARAPGRLDVMGGVADYSGARVCEMPLGIAAGAAVQKRSDGRVVCHSMQVGGTATMTVDELLAATPASIRTRFVGDDAWACYVVGCLWWLAREVNLDSAGGVTIIVDSDVPLGGGVASSAAVEVAVMSALTHAFDRPLRPMVLAVACQEVENRVVGAPCGVMDQVTAALGRESSMLELLCQADVTGLPAQVVGQVAVPDGLTFVGIHSGVRHEVSGDPYTDTRVAAFMAQRMIQRDRLPELTHLVEIQLASFRTSLRHWLPATCGGQAFIDEYQQTNDTVTSVDPKRAYRVRDAACHHVHEHARVTQFVAIMKQISAGEIRLEQGANRAGRLMIASHCSYGQRAHLGHDMTDLLVRLAMQRGPSAGIFGAKITGGGCGGTVALLLRDDDRARQTLASVRDAYHEGTGRESMLFEGTSPGAADLPPQRLAPGEWS